MSKFHTARIAHTLRPLTLAATLIVAGCLAPDGRGGGDNNGRVVTETGFALCVTHDDECAGGLRCDDDEGNGQCVPKPAACGDGPATCACAGTEVCDDSDRCAEENAGERLVCSPFDGGIEGEGEAPGDDPVPNPGVDPVALPAEWLSCVADADCVPVETECCDHCNGGGLVAVNRDHQDEADAALPADECLAVACTEMGCAPGEAECRDGACAIVGEGGGDPGPDPPVVVVACAELDEADCAGADGDCRPITGLSEEAACDGAGGPGEFAGCGPADVDCGAAMTCGMDPVTGRTLIFSSTCLLEGWDQCDYCPDEGPDPDPDPGDFIDENGDGWDDRWFACEDDADCAVIEIKCCDHCNGGEVRGVNREYVDAASQEFAPNDCGGVACTQMACRPVAPVCSAAGVCGPQP